MLAASVFLAGGQPGGGFSSETMRRFLLEGEVVRAAQIGKGITRPWRLTITDGRLTHDASFQDIDVRVQEAGFAGGGRELNFSDSYHYNIAAYELACLVGLDDIVPVTVEREWRGQKGSLTWWVDAKWDGLERMEKGLLPPDTRSWNRQMHKVRVFSQLVYDTDRNLQNILITEDWRISMIDFSRAFRTISQLQDESDLVKCDRVLFRRLHELERSAVARAVGSHLTRWEIDALMSRRDRIVGRFEKLIREKGEPEVLY